MERRVNRRRPPRIVLGALTAVLLLLTACAQPQATIAVRNERPDPVLWVPSGTDRLAQTLAARQDWQQIRAGGEQVRQQLGTAGQWCDPASLTHFILAPRGGIDLDLDGANRAPLSVDDFDIVDRIGPGHCWGVREAELVLG